MGTNKYGCRKSGDVCIEHDCPLLGDNFCEDAPFLADFVKEKTSLAITADRKETLESFVSDLKYDLAQYNNQSVESSVDIEKLFENIDRQVIATLKQ